MPDEDTAKGFTLNPDGSAEFPGVVISREDIADFSASIETPRGSLAVMASGEAIGQGAELFMTIAIGLTGTPVAEIDDPNEPKVVRRSTTRTVPPPPPADVMKPIRDTLAKALANAVDLDERNAAMETAIDAGLSREEAEKVLDSGD